MGIIEGSIQRGAGVERGPGAVYYVDTVNGVAGNPGSSWGSAFATMGAAFTVLGSHDHIYYRGRVAEHLTAPANVFSVTVEGVGTRPRHADTTPAGGNKSAQWQAAAAGTDPLCIVQQQGWRFKNMLMKAPGVGACVRLLRNGGAGDLERDAGHTSFEGVRFVGAAGTAGTGIEDSGGNGHIEVDEDCEFHDLLVGVKSVVGAGIGQPLFRSKISGTYRNNGSHIISAANELLVHDGHFGPFITLGIDFTGGVGSNMVHNNALYGTYATADYKPAANDCWNGNDASTGRTSAVPA